MSDQKARLDSLFAAAIAIESPDKRAAFIAQQCGDDKALQVQLMRLLAADLEAGSFLEKPPAGLGATTASDDSPGQRAAAMEAGSTSAFGPEQAVVLGSANHGVLKKLSRTIDIPRVSLREAEGDADSPIEKPHSPYVVLSSVTGRYRVDGEIARGGMGAILKGRDTDLGRDLAIKVLLDEYKDRPEVIQRFIEEAQIGGQLQHPGIAPVYELGQFADQRPFFSMKLVKGQTLSNLLSKRKDSSEDRGRFISIFEQVCQTLSYAHARGVIHRDLKPSNIMVGAFGEVQVMDWGLAKVLPSGGVDDEKRAQARHQDVSVIETRRSSGSDAPGSKKSGSSETKMGSVLGTPAYMPPEQALGEIDQLDQRVDIFGLGAVLCEILTGKPPYVAEDATAVFRMASRGRLNEAFERLNGCGADHELVDLAKQCLAAEREERLRDAGVLANRVTAYLESVEQRLRETELQRASEAARVVEQKKRLRVTLALAASVILLLLGGGSFAWWRNEQAQVARQREARNFEALAALIDQAGKALKANDVAEATLALEAASGRSVEGVTEDQRRALEHMNADLALLRDLAAIDQLRWTSPNPGVVAARTRQALRDFGVDPDATSLDELAARLSESLVLEQILPALDRLLLSDNSSAVRSLLRRLDSDSYRDAYRDAILADNLAKMRDLAEQDDAIRQPSGFAGFLGTNEVIPLERRRQVLQAAVNQKPGDFALLMNLGVAYLQPGQDTKKRYNARQLVENVARTDVGNREVEQAVRWFQAAVAAAPDNVAAHNNLSLALLDKGDRDGASASCRKIIELDPKFADAFNTVGIVLLSSGDVSGAIDSFQRSIEINPMAPQSYSSLGFALKRQGDLDGAIAAHRKSTEIDPNEAAFHSNLGSALLDIGNLAEAIAAYEKAIEVNSNYADAHYNLGIALEEKGDFSGAIVAYRKAIEIDPTSTSAYSNLGLVLNNQRDIDGAIAIYKKAIKIAPNDAKVHSNLGKALFEKGELADAIASVETALDLDPLYVIGYYNLGAMLSAKGDFDRAIAVYQKAIEINPLIDTTYSR